MQDIELYKRMLGITAPWVVSDVRLELKQRAVTIVVGYDHSIPVACPVCGGHATVHDHQQRKWRHLDTMQLKTIIECEVPRARFDEHGVKQLPVAWAEANARFSAMFEALVIGWLKETSISGVAEGSDQTAAVCCGKHGLFAAANGPAGSRAVVRKLQNTPFSLIQEWSIERFPYTYLDWSLGAERVVNATSTADRARVIGAAGRTVFRYEFGSDAVEIIGEVGGAVSGRLAALPDGSVIGRGGGDSLWRWDARTRKLARDAGRLPRADWDCEILWASDPDGGLLYTADAGGTLYTYRGQGAFSTPLCRVPYAPVTSLAVTFDGHVFGSAGTDMQRVFCFDPATGAVTDIGVGVSTLQQRRYCYQYGAAVTGRDGQIIFGEKDDLGHLWLYFTRIKKPQPS